MEGQLRVGAAALGLALSESQLAQLTQYADLLRKWGKVYNLTALRNPDEVLTHHLLDSLSVVEPLRKQAPSAVNLLDVGSGAGLPGIVIAIACPQMQVDCVDAVAKKAAFVQQVAGSLRMPNLRGIHSRVEKLQGRYEVITSRAFASIHDFVTLTGHVLAEGGSWAAMKGRFPHDEVAELPHGITVFHVEQLTVPGLAAERCLVWLRRQPG